MEKAKLEARDRYQATALHHAARYASTSVIRSLLIGGANKFALDVDLHTPIDTARIHYRTAAFQLLLQYVEKKPPKKGTLEVLDEHLKESRAADAEAGQSALAGAVQTIKSLVGGLAHGGSA